MSASSSTISSFVLIECLLWAERLAANIHLTTWRAIVCWKCPKPKNSYPELPGADLSICLKDCTHYHTFVSPANLLSLPPLLLNPPAWNSSKSQIKQNLKMFVSSHSVALQNTFPGSPCQWNLLTFCIAQSRCCRCWWGSSLAAIAKCCGNFWTETGRSEASEIRGLAEFLKWQEGQHWAWLWRLLLWAAEGFHEISASGDPGEPLQGKAVVEGSKINIFDSSVWWWEAPREWTQGKFSAPELHP